MADRSFPLSPRSSRGLEEGDIIAVPVGDGSWACLVAVEVPRSGVGSRKTFIAGLVPWRGDHEPTEADVTGLPIVEQGMTAIELFTEGGVQVVGNIGPVSSPFDSNYRDHYVGAHHRVWGWKTALRYAKQGLD